MTEMGGCYQRFLEQVVTQRLGHNPHLLAVPMGLRMTVGADAMAARRCRLVYGPAGGRRADPENRVKRAYRRF